MSKHDASNYDESLDAVRKLYSYTDQAWNGAIDEGGYVSRIECCYILTHLLSVTTDLLLSQPGRQGDEANTKMERGRKVSWESRRSGVYWSSGPWLGSYHRTDMSCSRLGVAIELWC